MFPIRDTIPSRRFPIMTWAIIAANVAVFVLQLRMPHRQLEQMSYLFGIVPMRYTHPRWAAYVGFPAHTYWPFLTSMFLHGGWFHILSNMWTLWIFGDNVEDRMGPIRFLVFYVFCGIVAGIIHVLTNADSTLPVIGASGAIAGVLAAYAFSFPLARIVCMVPIFFYPLFFEVHAFIFMLVWFLSQFFSGTASLAQHGQAGGIAWWAHVGGFAAGALTYAFFLPKRSRLPVPAETGIEGAWPRR